MNIEITGKSIIGQSRGEDTTDTFKAFDPTTGNGVEKGSLVSLKLVYTNLNLLAYLLPKLDFNSVPKEFSLLLILYPELRNCNVVKSGPLRPMALGCAGFSLDASKPL